MGSRRDARRLAIDLLYQADVTGVEPMTVLVGRGSEDEVDPFARELVEGVARRLEEIDATLGSHAEGWTVKRMPAVDRAILRVGIFELTARPDVPRGAAISEAVLAAKELSTKDSGRFVNGVLGRLARELEAPAEA